MSSFDSNFAFLLQLLCRAILVLIEGLALAASEIHLLVQVAVALLLAGLNLNLFALGVLVASSSNASLHLNIQGLFLVGDVLDAVDLLVLIIDIIGVLFPELES